MTPEELSKDFCHHWLAKAEHYDARELQGAFDSYFTLFVPHNRLYYLAAMQRGRLNQRERTMATSGYAEAIGHEFLYRQLIENGGQGDIETMAGLIGPNGAFDLFSGADHYTINPDRDRQLQSRLRSRSHKVVPEAVLEYLYQIRCNIFHGSKGFEQRQLEILQPSIRCLRKSVDAGLHAICNTTVQAAPM